MKKPWWTWSGLLARLNRRVIRRGRSPQEKAQRRLRMEGLEPRKLLSGVVNVQSLIVPAGQVGDLEVTITGQISAPQTVSFSTVDDTAVQGSDYFVPPVAATLTFQPGQTAPDLVPVFTAIDPAATANKTFIAAISNPTGDLTLGDNSQATCTITEPGPDTQVQWGITPAAPGQGTGMGVQPLISSPSVTITGPGSVTEGTSAPFLLSLSHSTTSTVSVFFQTQNGTASAGLNYSATSGYVAIPAGNTSAWVDVATIGGIYEPNSEYFWLDLTSASGASLGTPTSASASIENVASMPNATISGPSGDVLAGNAASFTVSLSERSALATTVYYQTQNGTASAGYNYTSESGSVVIPAYSATATFSVPTQDNPVYETSGEYFTADLTSAIGASVGSSVAANAVLSNELFWGGSNNGSFTNGPWHVGSATGPTVSWQAGYNDEFPSISGAETINLPSGVSADTLHFYSNGYTLSGGSITVGSAGLTVDVVSGATATINSAIGGNYGLTKVDSGTVALGGSNTFGGTGKSFTLSAGTLDIDNASALGNSNNTFVIGSGTTIDNTSGGLITTSNYAQTWQGNFTFAGSYPLNLGTGAVTLTANQQVTVSANTFTVGGLISGTYSLTKLGSGTLALGGTNTFGGTGKSFTLSAGALDIDNASALGNSNNTFVIGSGTTIDNTSGGLITTSNYAQTWQGNFTFAGSYPLNLGTGAVTLTANPQVTVSANTLTVGGPISGSSYGLTKLGSGTLALGGTNTFGGTAITGGVLSVASNNNLGATGMSVTINGGTLQATTGFTTSRQILLGPASGSGGGTIDVAAGQTLTCTGVLANNGSGTGSLTKTDAGTLTLSGSNIYTNGTTLDGGELSLGSSGAYRLQRHDQLRRRYPASHLQ